MCVWSCVWKQKEMCNLVRFKRVLSSPLSMPFIGHHWSAIHFDTTLWNYHITTRKCSMFESHGIAHLKWVAVVNRHTEIPFNDFDSFWLCWAAFFTCIIFMEKFLVYMCLETLLPLIVLEYTHARVFCVCQCVCVGATVALPCVQLSDPTSHIVRLCNVIVSLNVSVLNSISVCLLNARLLVSPCIGPCVLCEKGRTAHSQ